MIINLMCVGVILIGLALVASHYVAEGYIPKKAGEIRTAQEGHQRIYREYEIKPSRWVAVSGTLGGVMARTPTDHEQRRVARSGSFWH
jgi:hypothetical protein